MQTDTYTKFVLALIAIGLFAVAFMNTGLFDIPDAHAKAKKGQWKCTTAFLDGGDRDADKVDGQVQQVAQILTAAKASTVFKADFKHVLTGRSMDVLCYRR